MPPSVLLVEDEPDLAHVMSGALRRADHEVVVAGTGADALSAVGTLHVDVAVVDRGLPDLDGTAVVAQMRALGFSGAILVTSGYVGAEHEAACREAGADGVLSKPFKLSALVDRVAELAEGQTLVVV